MTIADRSEVEALVQIDWLLDFVLGVRNLDDANRILEFFEHGPAKAVEIGVIDVDDQGDSDVAVGSVGKQGQRVQVGCRYESIRDCFV